MPSRLEMAHRAVGKDDPELVRIVPVTFQGFFQGGLVLGFVLGMDAFQPSVHVAAGIDVLQVENFQHPVVPDQFVGLQIPLPDTDAAGPGGQGQPFRRGLQFPGQTVQFSDVAGEQGDAHGLLAFDHGLHAHVEVADPGVR